MTGFFISTALAQSAPEAAGSPAAAGLGSFMPFLLMIAVIYFMILRPQMRQQKEIKKMISELKIGDEVILASGLHGRISAVDINILKLKIADDVEVTVDRQAVQNKKNQTLNTKLK